MFNTGFDWIDVKAGWRDEVIDPTPGPWAECGWWDYRLGWAASWVARLVR